MIKKLLVCLIPFFGSCSTPAERVPYKALAATLDTIYREDQDPRVLLDDFAKRNAFNSPEAQVLIKKTRSIDSINVIKVTGIIDKYGWLPQDSIGADGSRTLFIVIQHADQKIQEKYLPIIRSAAKNKQLDMRFLVMMEDRVALGQGKKQIYGTQIASDGNGGFCVDALEDPDNVDKRRAEVGLGTIADYAQQWNIKWDVAAYKKQLPEIEKRAKEQFQQ